MAAGAFLVAPFQLLQLSAWSSLFFRWAQKCGSLKVLIMTMCAPGTDLDHTSPDGCQTWLLHTPQAHASSSLSLPLTAAARQRSSTQLLVPCQVPSLQLPLKTIMVSLESILPRKPCMALGFPCSTVCGACLTSTPCCLKHRRAHGLLGLHKA